MGRQVDTGGSSIRVARREMIRQRILAAAEYEFAKAGFAETRVTAVAGTAETSLATLYKSFASKDDIWNALIGQRMNELVGLVREATNGTPTPAHRILAGIRAQIVFFAEHPNFLRLNINESLSWATAQEAGRGGQRQIWRTGIEMIVHSAEAAADADQLAERLRPLTAARLIVAALQIWLTEWVEDGLQRPVDTVADELVEYLSGTLFCEAALGEAE